MAGLDTSATEFQPFGSAYIAPELRNTGVGALIEESPLEVLARYSSFARTSSYGFGGPAKPDTDLNLDPVSMGLLSEEDVDRLLDMCVLFLRGPALAATPLTPNLTVISHLFDSSSGISIVNYTPPASFVLVLRFFSRPSWLSRLHSARPVGTYSIRLQITPSSSWTE